MVGLSFGAEIDVAEVPEHLCGCVRVADFVYGVDENLGYVLLTNSANGQVVADAIERRFVGRMVRK
ncbi:MAG: hypothetical protein IPF98_02775 [Gemmatimonadetes bacterium]|nr:hypothetical protein [Gemmatimonadota bacterium]